MNMPVPGAYPLLIGVGDAESLTYDAWVAVLRAEPAIWGGDASVAYATAREADLVAAQKARDRVAEAILALEVLQASRMAAFLAFQGTPPPVVGVPAAPVRPSPSPEPPAPARPAATPATRRSMT